MEYTSAEANKLLRKLRREYDFILNKEEKTSVFIVSLGEDPESVRPQYDYAETQNALKSIEQKIIKIKHAINVFNLNTIIPELGMSIEQALIYIPQLTERKVKLTKMSECIPKERVRQDRYYSGNGLVEYRYTNYDIEKVTLDLEVVSDELSKAQTALDVVNTTIKFNIDVDID